jgi:hypothetical protein
MMTDNGHDEHAIYDIPGVSNGRISQGIYVSKSRTLSPRIVTIAQGNAVGQKPGPISQNSLVM